MTKNHYFQRLNSENNSLNLENNLEQNWVLLLVD